MDLPVILIDYYLNLKAASLLFFVYVYEYVSLYFRVSTLSYSQCLFVHYALVACNITVHATLYQEEHYLNLFYTIISCAPFQSEELN